MVLLERGYLFAYVKPIPVGLNESTNGPIASWKRYLSSKYIARKTKAVFSAKRTNVNKSHWNVCRLSANENILLLRSNKGVIIISI